MSKEPRVVTLVLCRVLLSHRLQKQRETQNTVGRKMQKGLNANLNNSEGVGLRAISFLTFHIKTTSELHKTPPHLCSEMEMRWHADGACMSSSLPPSHCVTASHLLFAPVEATSLSSALATHALCLATCLGLTQTQTQHWNGESCPGRMSPVSFYHLNNSCCCSLCAHIFHLINLCCWSLLSLFSLLFQWAAAAAQDCPAGSIPPLSGSASGFIIY